MYRYTCRRENFPRRKEENYNILDQHPRRIHPQKEILGPGCYNPHTYEHPCCGSQTIKMPSNPPKTCISFTFNTDDFFLPPSASYMYIRYFLSGSYWIVCWPAATNVVVCAGRAARDFESFLFTCSWEELAFFLLLVRRWLWWIALIFVSSFFFIPPLHHSIQHPQVGRRAVETITCGGPLGIYSAIHSRRGQDIPPFRPDNNNNA